MKLCRHTVASNASHAREVLKFRETCTEKSDKRQVSNSREMIDLNP